MRGRDILRRETGDCRLLDDTVIPNRTRYHCSNCGADLFDREARREIRKQRREKAASRKGA